MMQLYAPRMSIQSKEIVRHAIEDFQGGFDNIEIIKMMREDGFGELNWSDLKAGLNHISRVLNQKETS